ncbi:hypothetical protein [Deinococcus rufus]|uniref:Uncharacterized protein n=1 Tax=Deinococcus rufus TaxID=2136097 RepID=A0ABV7ZB50_9DEIO
MATLVQAATPPPHDARLRAEAVLAAQLDSVVEPSARAGQTSAVIVVPPDLATAVTLLASEYDYQATLYLSVPWVGAVRPSGRVRLEWPNHVRRPAEGRPPPFAGPAREARDPDPRYHGIWLLVGRVAS